MSISTQWAAPMICLLSFASAGCSTEVGSRASHELRDSRADDLSLLASRLGDIDASFADNTPESLQTRIIPMSDRSGARVIIDATNDRAYFPMPRHRRSFSDRDAVVSFIIEHFGARATRLDDEGRLEAWGSYIQRGASYFEDRRLGLRFQITDPILAYVAGVDGIIDVGGAATCFDPDGDCTGERASWMRAEGRLTAPNEDELCGNGVCVRFHAFYNKADFPPWARHGSNADMYTHAALSNTELWTGGFTFELQIDPSNPFDNVDNLPNEHVVGEEWVESANWCFGGCPAFSADGVCGVGEVSDQDVSGVVGTGNGPQGAHCYSSPSTPW